MLMSYISKCMCPLTIGLVSFLKAVLVGTRIVIINRQWEELVLNVHVFTIIINLFINIVSAEIVVFLRDC